jgi:hypothetical protein
MEDHMENEHEMQSIANANDIIEQRAVRNAKVSVEVGQHIIKG